jgi:hypothetical protein
MVKLVEVDPADIPTERLGRRGRVSYPLLKSFLESNVRCAKLDATGLDKNINYLRSVLYSYTRSHKLPIKIFSAGGDLHLLRLDMDSSGNIIPDWVPEAGSDERERPTEGNKGLMRDMEAMPITAIEVQRRFVQEKEKTTK